MNFRRIFAGILHGIVKFVQHVLVFQLPSMPANFHYYYYHVW